MKKHLGVAATLVVLSPLANAQATDSGAFDWSDVHGTIGLRMFRMEWSSWFGISASAVQYLIAGLETTVTPVASVRYKNFLLSGSYMLSKDFQFPDAGYPLTERKEYDVNLGYFVLPSLVASIGYKDVKYDTKDSVYRWNAKGPTVGLSGSAPLASWMSVYTNLAYGRLKLQDNSAFNGVRSKYLLTEAGFAFPLGSLNDSMSGFVVTAGYRYQRIGAVVNNVPALNGKELFEHAQGPVIGVSFSR